MTFLIYHGRGEVNIFFKPLWIKWPKVMKRAYCILRTIGIRVKWLKFPFCGFTFFRVHCGASFTVRFIAVRSPSSTKLISHENFRRNFYFEFLVVYFNKISCIFATVYALNSSVDCAKNNGDITLSILLLGLNVYKVQMGQRCRGFHSPGNFLYLYNSLINTLRWNYLKIFVYLTPRHVWRYFVIFII